MALPQKRRLVSTDWDHFIIDSEYEYVKALGQGAYGSVIMAQHQHSLEKCAIKNIARIDVKVRQSLALSSHS